MASKKTNSKMNTGLQSLMLGTAGAVMVKPNFKQAGPAAETETAATKDTANKSKAQALKKEGEQESEMESEVDVKSETRQESKTSTKQPTKTTTVPVIKKATQQDVNVTKVVEETMDEGNAGTATQAPGKQEAQTPGGGDARPARPSKRKSRKDAQLESVLKQENKKTRVIVENGQARRPTNMTLLDEYRIHLNILAAKRLVQPWKLLNEAIRRYLVEEGELKE